MEPAVLEMSLTDSPGVVERLDPPRVLTGWSYVIGHVVAVGWSFGFTGPAIAAIGIARLHALRQPGPRACGEPDSNTAAPVRESSTIVMKSA